MIEDFEVTKHSFERLPHGCTHFEVSFEGKNYKGQYRNRDVKWFHPQPDPYKHKIGIDELEKDVRKAFSGGVTDDIFEDFDVSKEVFKRLPHGWTKFEVILDGKQYTGHYRDGEVNWFHPHPDPDDHDVNIDKIEGEVHKVMVGKHLH